jgi:cell division protein FtsL
MMDNEYIDKDTIAEAQQKTNKKSPAKEKKRPAQSNALAQILNGEFLTKEFVLNNLNFIFFIIFLLLLIVGKGYYGKQLSKDVDTTQKEVDELTADFVEAKARFEEETRRYKLVERLEKRGLKESQNETKVIRIKTDKE